MGQSSVSAAILYTALNAGHVCLVVLLLIAIIDKGNLGKGRKSPFVFWQGLCYIIGTVIHFGELSEVETCLNLRPRSKLIA